MCRRLALSAALTLGALAGGGCGARNAGSRADLDGGDAPAAELPVAGRRSFDVVATFTPKPPSTPVPFGAAVPAANTFSVTLDVDAGRLIAGGAGQAAVVAVTSDDGLTFRAAAPFSVGGTSLVPCSGIASFTFETFEVTVTGSSFHGRAQGRAMFIDGDVESPLPFSADLAGVPDVTAPFLRAQLNALDPFDDFIALASEPLLSSATARLVAADGAAIDLIPIVVTGDLPVITGFRKPPVVLLSGQGYQVDTDRLVDLAGHSGVATVSLRLGDWPTPPLVPEDGFESAAGATYAGAAVVGPGGLAPIAGTHSLYVVGANGPLLMGVAPAPIFRARLALQAGDTFLRFSCRLTWTTGLAPGSAGVFSGSVRIGSAGGAIGAASPLRVPDMMPLEQRGAISLTAVQTIAIPLPKDVTDELVIEIDATPSPSPFCNSPLPGGLLIDDLRAE